MRVAFSYKYYTKSLFLIKTAAPLSLYNHYFEKKLFLFLNVKIYHYICWLKKFNYYDE